MNLRLSDEELAAVVQRAHEISSLQGRLDESTTSMDDYVKVAEELGVPREAMLQALNERFAFLNREIEPGTIVFAKSGDGRHYAAKVAASDENSVHVRFLNGGEASVPRHDLQSAAFSPGTNYEYMSAAYGMYFKAPVARFDRDSLTVTFNNWGTEETVSLAQVRTTIPRKPGSVSAWVMTACIALSTGVVGAIVTWLIMR